MLFTHLLYYSLIIWLFWHFLFPNFDQLTSFRFAKKAKRPRGFAARLFLINLLFILHPRFSGIPDFYLTLRILTCRVLFYRYLYYTLLSRLLPIFCTLCYTLFTKIIYDIFRFSIKILLLILLHLFLLYFTFYTYLNLETHC